jgi:WD40 repeat protein
VNLVQSLFRWRQSANRFLLGTLLFFSTSVLFLPPPAQAQEQGPSTRIEFLKYGSMATTVTQSQDGTYIAIGARNVPGGGSRVVLWNRSTDKRVRNMTFPSNQPPKLAFDSSGTRLAVGPAGRSSFIWSLRDDRSTPLQSASAPANDLAFGFGGTLGIAETSGAGGAIRVWPKGPNNAPAVLTTEGPVRSLSSSDYTSDVVLATGPTQVTLWNYRFSTTKRFDTFEQCEGELRQVEILGGGGHFYIVTQRRAECDPDYLCRIQAETRSVTHRIPRKNIRNLVALGGQRVAFSRGRHVYTLNLRTREESIVFQSENDVHDLSYADGRLIVANSDVVVLDV